MNEGIDPKRHLDIEGAYNVRDLGGYPTADGRQTRWGVLLRADGLNSLPVRSQAVLVEWGVRSVIDLRTSQAIQSAPNPFFGSSDVTYYHQNMLGDVTPYEKVSDGSPAERILEVYAGILDGRQSQIRETLATLALPDALPAVFHCAAGKDRTGILAALLLGLAGVSNETIVHDYASTAHYMVRGVLDADPERRAAGYGWRDYQDAGCPPEAMKETIRHLENSYGGIRGYIESLGLGSDRIEALHNAIVE